MRLVLSLLSYFSIFALFVTTNSICQSSFISILNRYIGCAVQINCYLITKECIFLVCFFSIIHNNEFLNGLLCIQVYSSNTFPSFGKHMIM